MPRRAVPARFMSKASSKNFAAASGSGTMMAMWRSFAMGLPFVELRGLIGKMLARTRRWAQFFRSLPRQIYLPAPRGADAPAGLRFLRRRPGRHFRAFGGTR